MLSTHHSLTHAWQSRSGASWGEQGYFRLARGVTYSGGLVHGECDVLGLGMYPTLLNDGDSAAPGAESGVGM